MALTQNSLNIADEMNNSMDNNNSSSSVTNGTTTANGLSQNTSTQNNSMFTPDGQQQQQVPPLATGAAVVKPWKRGGGRPSRRRGPGGLLVGGSNYSDATQDPSLPKRVKSELTVPKLPLSGYPSEHPFNKDGFRYILAEPDPHAPFRKEFEDGMEYAGKPLPRFLCRKWIPSSNLQIAMHDRAPQLKVSDDRLSVTGDKGYSMARSTHGVSLGTYYYEVTIEDQPDGSHTRIGFSQESANLQAPLGYDKFGYSWRSRFGSAFHQSQGFHFHEMAAYGSGDTLGLLIHLPPHHHPDSPTSFLPPIYKDRPLIRFKSFLYFEEKDEANRLAKSLNVLPGSKIIAFKNGRLMGVLFEDLNAGIYFPTISLYKNVTAKFNFGPHFKHPIEALDLNAPPRDCSSSDLRGQLPMNVQELENIMSQAKSMSDRGEEMFVEQTMAETLFFVENDGKLRLDQTYDY